jgi:hypothetical protein
MTRFLLSRLRNILLKVFGGGEKKSKGKRKKKEKKKKKSTAFVLNKLGK